MALLSPESSWLPIPANPTVTLTANASVSAVATPLVFGLAAYLDEQGVAYEPFDDLHTVAAALS